MEKTTYTQYQKKIIPYLDGSLSQEELSEFEAFISTHPDFEEQIRTKREEVDLMRKLIPSIGASPEALESMETEIRASIYNLLVEKPSGLMDQLRIKWEDWTLR